MLASGQAIELAKQAEHHNEVPIGALVVYDHKIVGRGYNQPISHHDPTAHAEIMTLRRAGLALENYRLVDTTLYVTLEPCAMCAGAMVHARVKRLVYGATEPRTGAAGSIVNIVEHDALNHRMAVTGGVCAEEASAMLKAFFASRRKNGSPAG